MYGTDVGYDYKAVFVDVGKNLFGFLSYGDSTVYTIFTYDEEDGFREVFSRTLNWTGSVRGMYAGEKFYLISANTIESFRLADCMRARSFISFLRTQLNLSDWQILRRWMILFFRSELYTFEDTNRYTVQLAFNITHKYSAVSAR